MNFAYGWAFSKPVRKVYYNITITGLSVAVALIIGTIELLGLLADQLGWAGGAWDWIGALDLNSWLLHRRAVRAHLGRGPADLALRPHRGQMGCPSTRPCPEDPALVSSGTRRRFTNMHLSDVTQNDLRAPSMTEAS